MSDRLYFGTIEEVLDPPNLIEIQIESYKQFLQRDEAPSKRKMTGLQAVFKEVFPSQGIGLQQHSFRKLGFVVYSQNDKTRSGQNI